MKLKRVKGKDPKDGWHFDVTHDDGRTMPVQVSTIGIETLARDHPGGSRGYAEQVAWTQARTTWEAADQQRAVKQSAGPVAKPKAAAKRKKTKAG